MARTRTTRGARIQSNLLWLHRGCGLLGRCGVCRSKHGRHDRTRDIQQKPYPSRFALSHSLRKFVPYPKPTNDADPRAIPNTKTQTRQAPSHKSQRASYLGFSCMTASSLLFLQGRAATGESALRRGWCCCCSCSLACAAAAMTASWLVEGATRGTSTGSSFLEMKSGAV